MDDLPSRPDRDTPAVDRKLIQPEDESPDVYVKEGKLYSRNPTEPKQRAVFELDEIRSTFDYRPIFQAANEFHKRNDLEGFVKCWTDAIMDVKVVGRSVLITIRPGE